MRRTLTMLLVIATLAITQGVYADAALSIGGGVTLTESQTGVSMGSRIDACRKIACKSGEAGRYGFIYRPIASWFSSTGLMPSLVMSDKPGRPVYRAAVDFNNVTNIEKVELTPDHGLTVWKADLVALKGYQVEIPCLVPGAYGFEWKVTSRDKKNRLVVVFIPISWSSGRTNGVVQHTMVKSAPESCWNFDDEQWVSLLSPAFLPATALPDPAYLALRAAGAQALRQIETQNMSKALDQPEPQPEPTQEQPRVETSKVEPGNGDGYVPTESATPKQKIYILKGEYRLQLTGRCGNAYSIRVAGKLRKGAAVAFARKGSAECCLAYVTKVDAGVIYAEVGYLGNRGILAGSKINMELEGK